MPYLTQVLAAREVLDRLHGPPEQPIIGPDGTLLAIRVERVRSDPEWDDLLNLDED